MTVTTDLPGGRPRSAPAALPRTSRRRGVGNSRTTARTTTWELDGEPARYYLVWITAMATDGDGTKSRT